MNISEEKRNDIIVYEGFLRRAARLPLPFMLKGSFVTRQYFSNPDDRIPNDLDWLYMNPLTGKDETVNTTPLALQVSWKLHQSLVRTRFKDLFDLMHLVAHAGFTPEVLQQSLRALVKECAKDKTNPARLQYLLSGNWDALFGMEEDNIWKMWRYRSAQLPFDDRAESITDRERLPADLTDFKLQIEDAFMMAGFYDIDLRTLHRL